MNTQEPTRGGCAICILFYGYIAMAIYTWICFPLPWRFPPANNGDWLVMRVLEIVMSIFWPFTWLAHWCNQPI
jgi:hypothetical protein